MTDLSLKVKYASFRKDHKKLNWLYTLERTHMARSHYAKGGKDRYYLVTLTTITFIRYLEVFLTGEPKELPFML